MLFHTVNTCTINRFGMLTEYPNEIKRIGIWLPKFMVHKAIDGIISNYKKITKEEAKVDIVNEQKYTIKNLEVRINLYIVLYDVLRNSYIVEPPIQILDIYKKHFKKEFDFKDLPNIIARIKILQTRLKKQVDELSGMQNNGTSFISFIMHIESILEYKIGSEMLYKLPYYIKEFDRIIADKKKLSHKA